MIDDPEDPRFKSAMSRLKNRLRPLLGRALDDAGLRELREVIDAHRKDSRQQWGVAFPRLVALVFPRHGKIDLVRADLERADIEAAIVNLTVKYPDITAQEIAWAVVRAFPDYQPGGLPHGRAH